MFAGSDPDDPALTTIPSVTALKTRFRKSGRNPIVPRLPGSFHAVHAANPDIVQFRDRTLMIYRGQDERGHDEIGVAMGPGESFDPVAWVLPRTPSICVDPNPQGFDSGHILDPAALVMNDRLLVYYTAHRSDWSSWNVPSHVGLAVSNDGERFDKYPEPVIEGMAPEVVAVDGSVFLFFQRLTRDGVLSFFMAKSDDGIHFDPDSIVQILAPSRVAGAFDEYSISTARIWSEGDWFLMAYGGCRRFVDYPESIGLARSRNLFDWEKWQGNPALSRGRPGTWDEGALWFATGHRVGDTTYLFYEGVGRAPEARGNRSLAYLCRHQDYGGYASCAFSQIGVAKATGHLAAW